MRNKILLLALSAVTISLCILPASAHSGGTDSQGGHYNRATGEYHFHHGYSAHGHYDVDGDGIADCPYDFDDKSGSSSSKSGSNSYNNGYDSGYDDGLIDGYENGYGDGKDAGYTLGYREGQKDMKAEMEVQIEAERKDASTSAYIISLLIGSPIVAYISAYLAALAGEKREKSLSEQVKNLNEELRNVKNAAKIHCSTSTPLPNAIAAPSRPLPEELRGTSQSKTVYVSKRGSKYHCKYRCSNATTAVKLDDLPLTYEPCQNCVPNGMIRQIAQSQSSVFSRVEYKDGSLILTFRGGSTYSYYNVPESVYKDMLAAPSKGKFYHKHIKDQYPYT